MTTAIKLPQFQGKSLIREPKIDSADFLEGDFGRAVLEEYKGIARADLERLREFVRPDLLTNLEKVVRK